MSMNRVTGGQLRSASSIEVAGSCGLGEDFGCDAGWLSAAELTVAEAFDEAGVGSEEAARSGEAADEDGLGFHVWGQSRGRTVQVLAATESTMPRSVAAGTILVVG